MFKQRNVSIKEENQWKYINVGLVTRWDIKRHDSLDSVTVSINDVVIEPSSITDTHFVYDFEVLRKQWFELLGNTTRECDLIAVEDACYYSQLQALNHYGKTSRNEDLRRSIFTADLTIFMRPVWLKHAQTRPSIIDAVEHYLTSDVHAETYKE